MTRSQRRRTDLLLALLPLLVGVVLLLHSLDALPEGLYDLLARAWPGLLVFLGAALLLRGRVRFGGLLAAVLSGLLVAGVGYFAFSQRVDDVRSDQVIDVTVPLAEDVELLIVNVELRDSDLQIAPALADQRAISGQFVGSSESEITQQQDSAAIGTLEYTISERKPNQFPLLEAIGRGRLRLEIPQDVDVLVNIAVQDGDVTLSLNDLNLERVTLDLDAGDAILTLPAHRPERVDSQERPSDLTLGSGDLTLLVPDNIDVRVNFDRRGSGIEPERDPAYIQTVEGVDGVLRRDVENADIRLFVNVTIPAGLLTLTVNR